MQYAELPAPPPLDSLVHCFWFLSGDDLGTEPQTIVADGRLEIVLHLAEPFARVDENGVARTQSRALLSGQLTGPIRLRPQGATDIVGIRFRTAAARAVFRVPIAELNDRVDALDGIAPSLASALYDAASRSNDPACRAIALASVLARFVVREPDRLAVSAIRSLDAHNAPPVARVADEFGVSARTLERRVLDHTGLPPSTLRRVLRFRRAFRMLDQAPPGTWSRIATSAGYYDQAHLIRDFRQFAGAPPAEFFRAGPELARAIITGE